MPQCGINGGQVDDLVADNSVDFDGATTDLSGNDNDYPARQACKDIGGRLPSVSELQCIKDHASSYNTYGSFSGSYWTSSEANTSYAYYIAIPGGGGAMSSYKSVSPYNVRCVRSNTVYTAP